MYLAIEGSGCDACCDVGCNGAGDDNSRETNEALLILQDGRGGVLAQG